MTEKHHPITPPPPKLVAAWCREADDNEPIFPQVAAKAAQWGADQELEACCEWIHGETSDECFVAILRAARRPKPPSLKEQARDALLRLAGCSNTFTSEDTADAAIIRRALEQLDD